MSLRMLSKTEGMELLEAAKKGDKLKIEIIINSFKGLKKSIYKNFIHKKDGISFEDFEQECNIKIMNCINDSREENIGQFCILVEKSIKRYALDFIEKNRNYNNFNVICESTINDFRVNKIDEGSNFENHVVSEITAYESYDTLIRDQLSKRENDAFHSHISGQSLEEYAAINGVKVDTARRTLKRAISKIVNKEEIRAFHCLTITFFIFLKMIKEYGEIVKEKANNRELQKIFNTSIEKLQKGENSPEDLISYAQNSLLAVQASKTKEDGDMEKILYDFMDILQVRYEKGGEVQGIKSGYKTLDRILGGLLKEDLIILAARPSMGKTAMALNLLLNTALKSQAKTVFFNLEMGTRQILDRAISLYTKIPLDNIKNASLTEDQWCQVSEAASKLACSSIKIYDKIFTLNGIGAVCRKLKIKGGLDIVIIDYLQLIESGEKTENRNQDISKITRRLKLLAKELDINIVVLSQLSRAPETRSDHRPMLSDLRESGSIEQDADAVMFLYRDEYYNKDSESKGIIECIVAKNRNGEVGTTRLKWRPEIQCIV